MRPPPVGDVRTEFGRKAAAESRETDSVRSSGRLRREMSQAL
jgi:hypothetical protein